MIIGSHSAAESLALRGDGVSLVAWAGETGGKSHSFPPVNGGCDGILNKTQEG